MDAQAALKLNIEVTIADLEKLLAHEKRLLAEVEKLLGAK